MHRVSGRGGERAGYGQVAARPTWLLMSILSIACLVASAAAQHAPPTPIAPVGSGPRSPAYRWSEVADATWYQLWVNDSTGTAINRWYPSWMVLAGGGECLVIPSESLELGQARWWVRSFNESQGASAWSTGLSFVVSDFPAPTPIAPTGLVETSTPSFEWIEVPGATWYQLWVSDSTGTRVNRWYTAAEVVVWSGQCAVSPTETIANGQATWWVRAWSQQSGSGPWSVGVGFTVDAAISPEPLAPLGAVTTITPTYRWKAFPGATWYQLWVQDSGGTRVNRWYPAAVVHENWWEEWCSIRPLEAVIAGPCMWWVRSWNAESGNGPWSAGAAFVASSPPIPGSPFCDAFTTASPTLLWSSFEPAPDLVEVERTGNQVRFIASDLQPARSGFAELEAPSWGINLGSDFRLRVRCFTEVDPTIGEDVWGSAVLALIVGSDQASIHAEAFRAPEFYPSQSIGTLIGVSGPWGSNADVIPGPAEMVTLHVEYDATSDSIRVGRFGYGLPPVFECEGFREWVGPVAEVRLRGYVSGPLPAIEAGQMWFDDFCVDEGVIVPR